MSDVYVKSECPESDSTTTFVTGHIEENKIIIAA